MPFAYDNSDDWPKEYLWTAPGAEVPTKFEVLDDEKLRYYLINFPGGTVRESGRVRRAARQRRRDLEAGVSADIAGTLRGRQERRRRIAAPAIEVDEERSAFMRKRAFRQQIRALTGSGGLTAFREVMREIDEAAAKNKNLVLSDLLETVGRTEEEGAVFVRTMAVNLGLDLRAGIPVLQRGTPPYDYVIACLRIFLGGEDEYPPYAGPPAAGIVAKENPWPGMAGSGRYPVQDFMFAPAPKLANWTSYPQYSYDQFYRPNTARLVGSSYEIPAATQIPQVETVSTRVAPSYEPAATASMPALSPALRAKGNPRRRKQSLPKVGSPEQDELRRRLHLGLPRWRELFDVEDLGFGAFRRTRTRDQILEEAYPPHLESLALWDELTAELEAENARLRVEAEALADWKADRAAAMSKGKGSDKVPSWWSKFASERARRRRVAAAELSEAYKRYKRSKDNPRRRRRAAERGAGMTEIVTCRGVMGPHPKRREDLCFMVDGEPVCVECYHETLEDLPTISRKNPVAPALGNGGYRQPSAEERRYWRARDTMGHLDLFEDELGLTRDEHDKVKAALRVLESDRTPESKLKSVVVERGMRVAKKHAGHGNTAARSLARLLSSARKNPVAIPLSAARAQRVPWPMAQNAGPFLPEMYPYGMGGRPYTYALNNGLDALNNPIDAAYMALSLEANLGHPSLSRKDKAVMRKAIRILRGRGSAAQKIDRLRNEVPELKENLRDLLATAKKNPGAYANPIDERARRAAAEAGFTLRGTSWPMMVPYWSPEKNRRHAIDAVLGFIQMRRGDEKDYPAVLHKLASIYHPEFPANEEIWERYEDIREGVRERRDRAKGKKKELTALLRCLPSMKTLSRVEPMRQQMMRAAANPFY